MVEINRAAKINIPEIARIHKACVLETNAKVYKEEVITEWLNQISERNINKQFNNSDWYVLKKDSQVIGFSQISLPEKELYQINIIPQLQNRGFGKQILNFIEDIFKSKNIDKIGLNATLNAVKFYERQGFKEVKKISFKLDKNYMEMVEMVKEF